MLRIKISLKINVFLCVIDTEFSPQFCVIICLFTVKPVFICDVISSARVTQGVFFNYTFVILCFITLRYSPCLNHRLNIDSFTSICDKTNWRLLLHDIPVTAPYR
jgi:hypothetical protein